MAGYLVWTTVLLAALSKVNGLGTPADISDFPGIVQIELGTSFIWTQQCAGSVLTSRHILSAASCFQGPITLRRGRAGTSIRSTGGSVVTFASANNHPDADFDADLTVVTLGIPLQLGSNIAQVPILGQGIYLPVGLPVQIAGWGTTVEGGSLSSSDLFSLGLNVINNDNCAVKYLDEKVITENQLCVGIGLNGRDYDPRDLGAPVFYQGTLVGVLSYGARNADDEVPLVTTNVGSYTSWIVANAV